MHICKRSSEKISSFFGEGGFKGLPCRVQDHVFFQGKKSMIAIHRQLLLYAHYTIPVSVTQSLSPAFTKVEIKEWLEGPCIVLFFLYLFEIVILVF